MGANNPQADRMRAQGYTEEEIEDMLKCDKEIDQGVDLFPLDPALEPGAKKARRADRTDTPKKAVRPEDKDKRTLIYLLSNVVRGFDDLEIVNPEREFLFTYCGKRYKVVMSVPRGQ
jgi:hypothetical protein